MSQHLSVAQLERLLERKRARLDGLVMRRERLQKRLDTIEGRIESLGGVRPEEANRHSVRKRPKNDQTLMAVITQLLSRHPDGLTLKDIAANVLATGYKTSSEKFENTVYQALYNHRSQLVHDPESHTYRLRQAKKSPRRTPKTASAKPPKATE
jgi:hypothetical protein